MKESSAILDLQAQWHSLKDPDRALAVAAILRSGVSRRKLARSLHRSESLIRRLHQYSEARPEDLELARQGHISANELLRRAKQAQLDREASEQQIAQNRSLQRVATAKNAILTWLAEDPVRAGGENTELNR